MPVDRMPEGETAMTGKDEALVPRIVSVLIALPNQVWRVLEETANEANTSLNKVCQDVFEEGLNTLRILVKPNREHLPPQEPDIRNRAFKAAWRKGYAARMAGMPRRHPYGDHRTFHGGVTFSRAFGRYWEEGWDEADRIGPEGGE